MESFNLKRIRIQKKIASLIPYLFLLKLFIQLTTIGIQKKHIKVLYLFYTI